MKILAIDSGIEKTGFAVFSLKSDNSFSYTVSGVIKTDIHKLLKDRIYHIYSELQKLIKFHHVKTIVIEQLFYFKNKKTFISVSQAQGVVLLLCAIHKLDIHFLTPLQIKSTVTGYGNSDKKSVRKILDMTLGNSIRYSDDDESDAVACAVAYCYLQKNFIK